MTAVRAEVARGVGDLQAGRVLQGDRPHNCVARPARYAGGQPRCYDGSMSGISGSEFARRWDSLWKTLRALPTVCRSPGTREAFELFAAILVYQRNALAGFTEDALHERLRSTRPTTPSRDLLIDQNPLFENFVPVQANYGLAQSHLASASLRLPVAFEKATGRWMKRDNDNPFFLKARDYFDAIKHLGCCRVGGQLGAAAESREAHALVIILIHRDDFEHGEEGDSKTAFRIKRKGVLDLTHACRIIDARQTLVETGLTSM
jgi:hypothetical protein